MWFARPRERLQAPHFQIKFNTRFRLDYHL